MDEIRTVLSEEQRAAFRPVPIELKKGECSFHHPLMVHGSYENRSGHLRRATVINVFGDGVLSGSDAELLAGVPPIPAGQPMEAASSRCSKRASECNVHRERPVSS